MGSCRGFGLENWRRDSRNFHPEIMAVRDPKSEIRMTNQIRNPNDESRSDASFVIGASGLIRHSDFGFRISPSRRWDARRLLLTLRPAAPPWRSQASLPSRWDQRGGLAGGGDSAVSRGIGLQRGADRGGAGGGGGGVSGDSAQSAGRSVSAGRQQRGVAAGVCCGSCRLFAAIVKGLGILAP